MNQRVGYAAGNIAGRDHIYWPRITPEQLLLLGANPRTVGCNLDTIMALAWRVRHFSLSGTGEVTVHYRTNNGVLPYQDTVRTLNWTIPPSIFSPMIISFPNINEPVTEAEAAQTELDILKHYDEATFPLGLQFLHNYGFLGRSYENVNFSGSTYSEFINPPDPPIVITDETYSSEPSSNQATEFSVFGSNPDETAVVFNSNLFYPDVKLLSEMNAGVGNGSDVSGSVVYSGGTDGTFTLNPVIAPPMVFGIKADAFFAVGGVEVVSLEGDFDIVATAVKYWQYANSRGLPIYDENSGGLISPAADRGPFS